MKKVNLQNVIWKEDKYFVAQCLNVDVSSFGSTKKEVVANLHEALELFFEEEKSPRVTRIDQPEIISSPLTYA